MALNLNPLPQDTEAAPQPLPDKQWAHTRPVPMPFDPSRMQLPHQVVNIKNTSPNQIHIIFNRAKQPVELRPGEERFGVEMLVEDIKYFRDLRKPGKLDILGYPRPLHPVVITDLDDPAGNAPQPEIIPSGQRPPPSRR